MKLKICLVGVFVVFFAVGSVQAQTPEEVWREYQFLNPSPSELQRMYSILDEPYYSLMLKRLTETETPSNPKELIWLLVDMINRLPRDHDNLFRGFWRRFSLTATQDDLFFILTNYKIDKLPTSLDWFIDDVVDTFWRRETSLFAIRGVACNGPKIYQQIFLEKFFALNPSSYELALAVPICDENRKLFLEKLFVHPDLTKQDLIDVLVFVNRYPVLYDHYFSLLLTRQNELDINDLSFIENTCHAGSYCSFFAQLKFSALLQRRQELIEIMRKKESGGF